MVEMEKVYFRCYVVHSLCLTRQVQLSSTEAVKSFNGIQHARSTQADKTIFLVTLSSGKQKEIRRL